jgi:hypothetical protein
VSRTPAILILLATFNMLDETQPIAIESVLGRVDADDDSARVGRDFELSLFHARRRDSDRCLAMEPRLRELEVGQTLHGRSSE